MDRLRAVFVASVVSLFAVGGCNSPDAVLLTVTGDAKAEQYDLYVRDDDAMSIWHSGFQPVQAQGEPPRDITMDKLKIALKLAHGGHYTILMVGVIGDLQGAKPAPGSTQMFWAGRVNIGGTTNVDARLLTVPPGDDSDGDLWPDAMDFPSHKPEAAMLYAGHPDVLDCDDKVDMPTASGGNKVNLTAAQINPFAAEICNDGFDENCDGNGDEACVDKDGDHDFAGDDCDDNDPKRHHPTDIDPFPDPPNCCGYSLGKANTPDALTDFLHDSGDPACFAATCTHDMVLCPMKRCGDGVDESCRGGQMNDPANDTRCSVDDDCDGYPAAPQGNDCDDHNPNVHPGAMEICGNGIDDNCNGIVDEGCVPCDLDGDGFQRNDPAHNCNPMPGKIDCNDYDSGVYPGQTAKWGNKEGGLGDAVTVSNSALRGDCRRIYESTGTTGVARIAAMGEMVGDFDCNGVAYEGCPPVKCDADGDGWPSNAAGCAIAGLTADCNDNDPTIWPGAPDKCGNGILENCNQDTVCTGHDKDGDHYTDDVDCNDNDPSVHPWAVELCNGADDDCDGIIDENNPDGTGAPMVMNGAVIQCNDSNKGECKKGLGHCVCSNQKESGFFDSDRVYCPTEMAGGMKPPRCFGAGQPQSQSCDATNPKDDDCDGRVDAPDGKNLAALGMPCGISVGQCHAGMVTACDMTKTNCFETFGRIPAAQTWYVCSPDAVCPQAELCNGLDDDCDGYPAAPQGSDCDDTNPNVHPGAMEKCNGINDNCSGNFPADDGMDECTAASGFPNCCSSQGACRNLGTDLNNCTTCGNVCDLLKANACAPGGCQCSGAPACGSGFWCNGGCQACHDKMHCGPSCVPCTTGVCKSDFSGCVGCNVDTDCSSTQWCSAGNCVPKGNLGAGCSGRNQCLSNNCVDGVCCSSAMCGLCQLCNVNGAKGTCTVAVGQNPHGNTCTANPATCQQGVCNAAGNCNVPDTTACGSPTCTSAMLTTYTCTSGSCGSASSSCGAYQCNGSANACLMSCLGDANCTSGNYCDGTGHCAAKKGNGQGCAAGKECTSNNCVDGVCCGSAACAQCQACNLGGSLGTCSSVKNADDPDSCPSTTSTCDSNGVCKLKNGQSCVSGGAGSCASGNCSATVCCDTACTNPATCIVGVLTTYSCLTPSPGTCSPTVSACGAPNHCSGNACVPCTVNTACGAGCTDCTALLNNKACVSGGTTCGCNTTADCDSTTSNGCKPYMGSGPNVCLCGNNLACPSGKMCSNGTCM